MYHLYFVRRGAGKKDALTEDGFLVFEADENGDFVANFQLRIDVFFMDNFFTIQV